MNSNYEKINEAGAFDVRFSDIREAAMILRHNMAKNYRKDRTSETPPQPTIEFSDTNSKLGNVIVAEARRDVSIAFESATPIMPIADNVNQDIYDLET